MDLYSRALLGCPMLADFLGKYISAFEKLRIMLQGFRVTVGSLFSLKLCLLSVDSVNHFGWKRDEHDCRRGMASKTDGIESVEESYTCTTPNYFFGSLAI